MRTHYNRQCSRHCEERSDEAIQPGVAALDCCAELVIGPATSGRTRWRAMTGGLSPPAEQEHRLLAEQIPEPPRHFQPHPPAPGVERHRLPHRGSDRVAKLAKVLDAAERDVRRLPPRIAQIVGLRHVAAARELQPYLPVAEIRKRNDAVAADAQHV